MKLFSDTSIGVDLGDGTLKLVELARRGRTARLVRAWREETGAEPGAELDALARLAREERWGPSTRVIVAAPARGSFTRTYVLPAVEADRAEELVRYEVLRELDLPADELVVRHHLRRGAVEQQAYALALRKADVQRRVADLEQRHIPYDDLELPGFALASFHEHEQPFGHDRILLAVGRRATELVLQSEDGLWARHLPLGLDDLPDRETLAQRLADEIAGAAAWALPRDRAFAPQDCVLSEEGALDAQLTGALRRALHLPVRRCGALERIGTPPRPSAGAPAAEQILCMGKAFGLALAGLGLGRYRCPVLRGNPRREAARQTPLLGLSVLVASAALVALPWVVERRAEQLDAALSVTDIGDARDLVATHDRISAERDLVQRRLDTLAALARRRTAAYSLRPALDVLAGLLSVRGESVLHVEELQLIAPASREPARLEIVLVADRTFDAHLAGDLRVSLSGLFGELAVEGPSPGPAADLSRFALEVELP